jgi:hypothetical protein
MKELKAVIIRTRGAARLHPSQLKRLGLPRTLYENLQTLSLTLCEQMPLNELLAQLDNGQNSSDAHNQ